jgi:hypothetical protein
MTLQKCKVPNFFNIFYAMKGKKMALHGFSGLALGYGPY